MAERCVCAGLPAVPPCEPPIQHHHAIGQQRLKRLFPKGAYWDADAGVWKPFDRTARSVLPSPVRRRSRQKILDDPRIRVWACVRHHGLETDAVLRLPLPGSVWEFAEEYGLVGMLENDLARRAS